MPEIKKVEIETEQSPPPQQTLPETQTQMAIAFGQMTETNRQLMSEIATDRSERSATATMLTEALSEIRSLRQQQAITTHQAEQLKESQTAIISAMADSENEDQTDVIPVTPMETHVKIDQVPINTKKSWIQKVLFG